MKNLIIIILLFAVGAGIFGMITKYYSPSQDNNQPVACTMEAKLCPDGSYVARTGPKCEFSACPQASSTVSEPTNTNTVLSVGQKAKIGDTTITLNNVTQDSRCPSGVQCIWAGAITTNITLTDVTQTVTKDLASNEAPYTFGKNTISIVFVSPAKISTNNILESDYKITFNIIPKAVTTSNGNTGYLSGRVTISPVCPVERFPPDPQCAPRGYSTSISITGTNFLKQIASDANGYFSLNLPSGTYNLKPVSVNVFPRCMETNNVIVKTNSSTTVSISCDSGIR